MAKKKTPHYSTAPTIENKEAVPLEPCVKFTVEAWVEWDKHWNSKLNKFEGYYDRWIGKPPTRSETWQAQFHKKLTWQSEKTLTARFHSAIFPNSAPIETDATEVPDELSAIIAKSIVGHWFKIGKFSHEFLRAMRSAYIYGTGLLEDDWYMRQEEVVEREPVSIPDYRPMVDGVTGQPVLDDSGNVRSQQVGMRQIMQERRRMAIVEDRYRVRKGNIFAWRVHPHKLDDDDDFPMIKQEFVTYGDLLKLQKEAEVKGYAGFENMKKIKDDKSVANEKDLRRLQIGGDKYTDTDNPRIELLHYWGEYADNGKEKKPMHIIVANRKYKLQLVENPYWHKKPPVFRIVWTEDEKPSYYGIGGAQIGEAAEDRVNTTVNIRIDERKKNIKGGGWYNANDKKIKKTQLMKNIPGLYKPCSDVNNAVRPDVPIPSTPDDYKEEEVAVNDHREIVGATTSLLPTADVKQQHDTLGGMQLLMSQSAQRLRPDLVMMEIMGVRRAANRAFLLTRQFMSKPETIELLASQDQLKQQQIDKVYTITPDQIIKKANFHCVGLSESIDKAQNIDKLMRFAEATGKVPPMQMVTNYQGIMKRIALWLGFEDIEDFVLMNPMNPLAPIQPGGVQGAPGQQAPPGALPQPAGGLPPQLIAQIAQGVSGQGARV